jgi:hypothetical protein
MWKVAGVAGTDVLTDVDFDLRLVDTSCSSWFLLFLSFEFLDSHFLKRLSAAVLRLLVPVSALQAIYSSILDDIKMAIVESTNASMSPKSNTCRTHSAKPLIASLA